MSVSLVKKKFNIREYHQMIKANLFDEDDHLELIDGEIIEMAPIGSRHAALVSRLNALLYFNLGRQVIVNVQNPVILDDLSQPEPDIALLRPRADYYRDEHPTATDILLIIEVAETTAITDREIKIPKYAQANIVEVWLFDILSDRLEVYRQPAEGQYQEVRILARPDSIDLVSFPEIVFSVNELLG